MLTSLQSAMQYFDQVSAAAQFVRDAAGIETPPDVAIVLGSGLGGFAASLESSTTIPYAQIPHWPPSAVVGHTGSLVVGGCHGRIVAALSGRVHLYEGHDPRTVAFAVRAIGRLGVKTLVLTNAAGGINTRFQSGALMVIDDHINLTGANPLAGLNDDRFGPRFPDMTGAYSERLRRIADEAGATLGLTLPHGVYAGLLGPSYETPAEIRHLRTIGADAVGMSTVLETIAARHMGLDVLGLSCISNMAAGVLPQPLSHQEVLDTTARVAGQFQALLAEIVSRI